MTLIPARELVNTALQAYAEKWGYIWGKAGQVWTQAQQDKATRDMTVRYGQRWVGKKVADCSGLFVWAYKQHGMTIYHGSNTIWNKHIVEETKAALAGVVKVRRGAAVFQNVDGKRTHIGWYQGGGMVVEERGTQSGCILSPLATWDEVGELKELGYSGEIYETFEIVPLDTLQKGSKGELVKYLQTVLAEQGYDIGKDKDGKPLIDGIFGSSVLSAVRAFQHDHGLTPDGKVGQKTWKIIKSLVQDDEPDDDEDEPEDVQVEDDPPADAWDSMTLEQKVEDLNQRLRAVEGGESNG